MGRSKRRQALNAVLATVVAGLVVVPAGASAFADRGTRAGSATGTTADAGEALQRDADGALGTASHDHSTHQHTPVSTQNSIAAAAENAVNDGADLAQTATLPSGFADVEAIGDISEATSVAFVPDGRAYAGTAFVALKTGVIKSFDYNTSTKQFEPKATSTTFADLSRQVNNYWDRGLTGITLDPQFGTAGHNFVYVNYAYNHDPRVAETDVPHWGDPDSAYDVCPEGQEASVGPPPVSGCVATVRITRLTAVLGTDGWVMQSGSELPLLMGTCQQFGSHASGDVVFGPDGYLYASAGDGASFTTEDYGQADNPCGDPADEGGSLRSQDYQTSGDPLGFAGSVVRINAANGNAPDGSTDMAKRLVAYGQRNPWRLTFRPGTSELWSGDVGAGTWEEINRLDVSTLSTTSPVPVNRGWPCYEGAYTGSVRQPGWDALNKPICENLYAKGTGAVAAPYFSYHTRGDLLTPGEDCLNDTSANSGVAFGSTSSNYPSAYQGALFFADFARSCVWMLGKKSDGTPDPDVILPFVQAASTPVDLTTGPGGDLYYVDYGLDDNGVPTEDAAGVHRIVYTGTNATPTAKITANKTSGPAPLAVTFSGLSSTDPDNDTLSYAWDLDGNGSYTDSISATPSKTYPAGTYTVGLKVSDDHGHTSTATQQIQSGNSAPVLGTVTPSPTLTWAVGQSVAFSASATDPQVQGPMPASAFSWQLSIRHCPGGVCHTHSLQTYGGVSSGSFSAPDHEYPSHLLLTVTVTDSGGLTDTRTIELDPKTVALGFASTPSGATVTLNGADHATPYTETFIQGSTFNLTAAETAGGGAFASWSDGGARSHPITAPASPTTYTAAYATNSAPTVARVSTYPDGGWYVGQTLGFDAAATDAQQLLPDSAYSFVMERQDCDSGCPRVVVQRWTSVATGRFVVPAMPYPSHLFLTATATDDQGATGSSTIRIEPRAGSLTVQTRRARLKVGVDGVNRKDGWTGAVVAGSTVRLAAPLHQVRGGVRYVFVKWSDGGARKHDLVVWETPLSVKAVYRRVS